MVMERIEEAEITLVTGDTKLASCTPFGGGTPGTCPPSAICSPHSCGPTVCAPLTRSGCPPDCIPACSPSVMPPDCGPTRGDPKPPKPRPN